MTGESDLTIRFGGDVAGLDSAVAVAKAQMQGFNAELRKLAQEAAKSSGAASDQLTKALREAAASAAGAKRELAGLTHVPQEVSDGFKKMTESVANNAYELGPWTGQHVELAKNAVLGLQGALGSAGIAFAAIGAAAAAAMAVVGAAAIHMGEAAERAQSQFGLTGVALTQLGAVASKAGVETKDVASALQDLSKKAGEGDKDIVAAAGALGLTADQLRSKDLAGLMRTLQQAYDRNGDSANRYAAMQKLLGSKFEELYPVMQQGLTGLDNLYAAADRSSSAISGPLRDALAGTVGASREAGAAWVELKQSIEGAVLALYEQFKPAIDGAILVFANLIRNIASAVQGFADASREASVTQLALEGIAGAAKILVTALAGVTAAFETLLTTASFVLKEIGDLARGVIGVFNELWRSVRGDGGDVASAWSKMTGDMKKDTVDWANNLRTISKQTKQEFNTIWGDGVKAAAPASNLRVTGNPEPPAKSGGGGAKGGSGGDALATARKEIDGEIQAEREAFEEKKIIYEGEASLKNISESQKLRMVQQAAEAEYNVVRGLYEKERELAGLKPQQKQEIDNKILALDAQFQKTLLQSHYAAARQDAQAWEQMSLTISQDMSAAIMGLLEGTKKLSDSLRDIARQIVGYFVKMGADMVANFTVTIAKNVAQSIIGEQAMTGATVAGVAARSAAVASGSVADVAAKLTSVIKSIMSSAAETTAGVTGFLAPVLGPGAIGAGAAAGAAVAGLASAAAFDIGAYRIPSDMLSIVHKDELVMTAPQAGAFRNAMSALSNGGAAGDNAGGGDTHQHFHYAPNVSAVDGQSVGAWFRSNERHIMRAMGEMVRNGAHLGVRGV